MKMKKRVLAVALVVVLAVMLAVPAGAAFRSTTINVVYGLTLKFNDQAVKLTDAKGNTVDPIVYNGTTYVPIRAISELFGAGVDYDSSSGTAFVYDDFAEVCAVVNEMHRIVDDAFEVCLLDLMSVGDGSFSDNSSPFDECNAKIENMFDVLAQLQEDNRNMSIVVEKVLPNYGKFLVSFAEVNNAYNFLRKNQSNNYYGNKFIDACHDAIDKHDAAVRSISAFFDNYCLWRDIGLYD